MEKQQQELDEIIIDIENLNYGILNFFDYRVILLVVILVSAIAANIGSYLQKVKN